MPKCKCQKKIAIKLQRYFYSRFTQTEEDIQTDMYKVLDQLTAHDDAWPFVDPVEEDYAPNYYKVIRRPMNLHTMEERLDSGYYTDFSMFQADFKLIVNNCRLYNGQVNEYTTMVSNLQAEFDRLTEKYIHRLSSSDEEIAVEYQLPTPSRKHKLKPSESPSRQRMKKRKSHSEPTEQESSSAAEPIENKEKVDVPPEPEVEPKKSKESHKSKEGKDKKKHKGHHRRHHHRHGKHSKNHRKDSHKSEHSEHSTSKHSKKQKHSKNKDKEGKKSKEKKKKNKNKPEPPEQLERAVSQESLESSNRSRSASPLPSIHTPSPSPTELDQPTELSDQLNDSEFYKDKYDKIKERRRHAAKDAWDTLFDHKQKSGGDKQKPNLPVTEKDKNPKLRETIEKLKAKNEKYKETSLFNSLFTPSRGNTDKNSDSSQHKDSPDNDGEENPFSDDESLDNQRSKNKDKGYKKNAAKNESASEALEQAVKDISKWLDDAPKGSVGSSPCDSPAQTISTEEHDNSRLDDEFNQSEKSTNTRKEITRKRPSSREPKLVKRREIQRTIDRLQPGKSKGNLLTNLSNKNSDKTEDTAPSGPLSKVRDATKTEESSPKLSLGSVLQTVDFTLGNDHNFVNNETKVDEKESPKAIEAEKFANKREDTPIEKKTEEKPVQSNKKDAEVETELCVSESTKPSQEKATPNLSAWFKAFGAPKSTTTTTTVKKKVEDTEVEEKATDTAASDNKAVSPKNITKYDSPIEPFTPNPEGGDSPLPSVSATPRQRRTSTGSSVSERSSFSQDLDSPRHQMSHTSPLLRSPASPRTDDFQKITYPIINGTVRAGFYQDTTSIKSSPEKSCSPREGPQSPYSPYSQHVYASNNAMGSSTPNYFVDHNKSPLPSYGQNPPTYYDTSKAAVVNKHTRSHDEYPSLSTDTYQQNQYNSQYSPAHSPYTQTQASNYSQVQNAPQTTTSDPISQVNIPQTLPDPKATLFPVKKRTYNEPDPIPAKKPSECKDIPSTVQNKNDYQKISQSLHTMSSLPTSSVDNIALALSEKSEMAKLNSLREKSSNYIDRHSIETRENTHYENNDSAHAKKDHPTVDINKPIGIIKNDSVDMINMGYMNPEGERRNSGDAHEDFARDIQKSGLNHQDKGYEVEAIAINLGLNSQHVQKTHPKPSTPTIPPAHVHERTHNEALNQNLAHVYHGQYDAITSGQSISNFSLNDIELANKKLFTCNPAPSTAALDYGNWKMSNAVRKQDMLPSDYSNSYATSVEKLKTDISSSNTSAINYKNIQQQYNNYNVPRTSLQRTQELQQNLPSELRIPNPRGHLKHDQMAVASSITDTELIAKNIDTLAKSQKPDKHVQNHPLVGTIPYKTTYSAHSSHPLDSLRNLPQMLERYSNDDRYLSTFANPSSLYHDKTFQMAQMFNKSMSSDVHSTSTSASMYSEPSAAITKDNGIYKTSANISNIQADAKAKMKKKRTSDAKPMPVMAGQSYSSSCGTDVLSSVKTSMMPGSAFNFGTSANMTLSSGLYGDNTGFSIEDLRNSTANQLMAANYMAAAVAHQQRNNAEAAAVEKLVKPAHQNSTHTSGSFPYIGHTQVRAGYPFVGADPSSPLYQQYLQRHQEELLRQTGAQIMGLYPGYPTGLSVRQPFDSINRPSWL